MSCIPVVSNHNTQVPKPAENSRKGIFIDKRDNKSYSTIKIGSQTWFAENFAYLPQIDTIHVSVYGYKGSSISEAKSTASFKQYGALYSWEFANELAPEGWRLPSDADWQRLEKEVGIDSELLETIGWRGTNNEAEKLKPGGNTGFDVLFAGWKTDLGQFKFQGQHANFWCADSYDTERAFERLFGVMNQKIGRNYGNKGCGFSVRYVK